MNFGQQMLTNEKREGEDLMVLLEMRCRQLSSGVSVGLGGGGRVVVCLRYQYEIALIQECFSGRIYYGA